MRSMSARGCPDVAVAKCTSVSVTSLALLQPQNSQGLPVINPLVSSGNGDKKYRNICMHHTKPTGIALPWSIATAAFI